MMLTFLKPAWKMQQNFQGLKYPHAASLWLENTHVVMMPSFIDKNMLE